MSSSAGDTLFIRPLTNPFLLEISGKVSGRARVRDERYAAEGGIV